MIVNVVRGTSRLQQLRHPYGEERRELLSDLALSVCTAVTQKVVPSLLMLPYLT